MNVVVGNHFRERRRARRARRAPHQRRRGAGAVGMDRFLEAAREMVARETFASLHRAVTYVDVNNAIDGTS